VYTFDSAKWRLGIPCKYGHLWPGTNFSLRSTYVSPKGVPISRCAGCKTGTRHPQDWLIKFIDNPASGVPEGKYLGILCPKEHNWHDTGYSLRRKGACIECEKEKRLNTDPEVLRARARTHYLKNKEDYARRSREQCIRDIESGRGAERRARNRDRILAQRTRYRRQAGAESREQIALEAKLNASLRRRRSSCPIADLVAKQEKQMKTVFPEYWAEEKARHHRHRWKLKYLISSELRFYNRSKAKARKAKIRGNTAEHLTPGAISAHFALFDYSCAYCGDNSCDLQVEHVWPISRGGEHGRRNIVPACAKCNYSKFDHHPYRWYTKQPFFTEQRWNKICQTLENDFTYQN
jgi:5-methylcytosine-specific restriction endonuclease McrA